MIVVQIAVVIIILQLILLAIFKFKMLLQQSYCRSRVCLNGKTAIVTGGSQGIGYQIVLGLASRGCRVIIADCVVSTAIKDAIYKETHNSNIVMKYINLASFKSVREFADDILKSEDKVDILVNNAGVGYGQSHISEDGINYTMQVNYYSAFLLTHLLVALLRKSQVGARVIFTSSVLSFLHPITAWSVRKGGIEKGFESFSYPISKFCQISASEIFAVKLKMFGITSNCFHPYIAKTTIFKKSMKDSTWCEYIWMIALYIVAQITGKSPEEAAQTGIYLACANEVKGATGGYFGGMEHSWKPPRTQNVELMRAIWEVSERVVKLKPEEKIEYQE